MKKNDYPSSQIEQHPKIGWIYSGNLNKLDAVTWLVPTQVLRDAGWVVKLIAVGDPNQKEIHGVDVTHIPRPDVFLLRQIFFHLRVLRLLYSQLNDIDILLFHEATAPWFLGFSVFLKLMRRYRPLFVMDSRTLPMEPEDKATWRDRLRGVFAIQMNKMANHFFDGRTTITKRMAAALSIPPKRLWGIWQSGVELEAFSGAIQARNFPKVDEPIILIYIGCMHHERNLLTLSRAVTQANADEHIFTLNIVGDGNARSELEHYAKEKGRHVHIFPPVPHEQIPLWLSKAHIGTLPFPDEEKFRVSSPIKLFEYLAAGLPILATRIVCHTDVTGNDDVAFWTENADQEGLFEALRQIQENRNRFAEMGKNAVALAEKWTWQSSADNLKRALEYGFRENITP